MTRPLPVATMLHLARGMSDLALVKFERDLRRDPEAMSRIVLHANRLDLLNNGWPDQSIDALLKFREHRELEEERWAADEAGAADLKIDGGQP